MYRGTPSPIFDVPEFPTLRRVKPLPKRRRMSGSDDLHSMAVQGASALLQQSAAAAFLQHQQQAPPAPPGPNATAEELLAHADTLSARMALQNYYMPLLGGVQNMLANASESGGNNTTAAAVAAAALAAVAGGGKNGHLSLPFSDLESVEFGVHFAAAAAAAAAAGVAMGGLGGLGMELAGMNLGLGMNSPTGFSGGGRGRDEEDRRGDDDYSDRRHHGHGNTKKRKVPANSTGSPRGGERSGSPSSYLDDDGNELAGPEGESFGPQNEELLREGTEIGNATETGTETATGTATGTTS